MQARARGLLRKGVRARIVEQTTHLARFREPYEHAVTRRDPFVNEPLPAAMDGCFEGGAISCHDPGFAETRAPYRERDEQVDEVFAAQEWTRGEQQRRILADSLRDFARLPFEQ